MIRRCAAEALEGRTLFATFTVISTADSGAGSLRQAINDANSSIGADIIVFDVGLGAITISPSSQLPTITDPVLIDGTTQPGFTGAPIVELDGSGSSGDGLRITAGETTIRGLVINDWDWGITMSNEGGNVIVGNYIGTDITGTASDGNSTGGILIEVGDNQIGGLGPDADDPSDDFLDGNVISGNDGYGIFIDNGGDANLVVNNMIGLDVTGTIPIGNDDSGIRIDGDDNLIGDLDEPDNVNVIAQNGGDGVEVTSSGTGNAILGNSIFQNTDQGINLSPDGVNNNDSADLDIDTGANNQQNYPILSSARFVGSQFVVEGSFISTPNTPFRLQFFTGVDDDPNDHGEGQFQLEVQDVTLIDPLGTSDADVNIVNLPIDQLEVTTGSDGTVQFSVVLDGVPAGRHVTSTATNLITSDTSEFGLNVISGTTAGINVEGNGEQIITGDLTPDPADGTDFGSVFLDDVDGEIQTFVVLNTGDAAVALTGNPRVQISGPNAADFVVESFPSGVIDPDDDSSFVIRFIPSGVGLRTAVVTIPNTDPDENPYVFAIQGTGAQKLVTVGDVSVVEGNAGTTDAVFTVTLSAPALNDVVLTYQTGDLTATGGVDYVVSTGTAIILAGDTTTTITVPVIGDTVFEANETFNVTVTTLDGTVAVSDGVGVGTIVNDEVAPTLSVADAQQAEGQAGQTQFVFTVSLNAPSTLPATVNFSTADGTAIAGSDYLSTSGILTIPAGQATGTVTVVVLGDRVIEPNETFLLNLSAPSFATVLDGQGIGTIVNDDATFTVTPPDSTGTGGGGPGVVVERAGGTFAPFTVALSLVSTEVITVRYATQDGSATASSDYIPNGGLLTFQPGETSKEIPVFVTADTLVEGDENFRLVLFQPTNSGLTNGDFPVTIRDSTLPFLTLDNKNPLTYTDANGDQVTVAIKGQGQANVQFANTSGVGNAVGLVVDGTSAGSTVAVTSTGGGTAIGGVSINRNVKAVAAPDTDLTDNFSTLGTIKAVNFRSATGGGQMNLFIRGNVAANFGRVENYNIDSDANLKTLSVGEWLDTDGDADLIHAPGINSITSRGDFAADIVTGNLAKVNVGGALAGADIRPTVGIKQLSASAIRDTNIFVGVNGTVDADRALPASDADLFNDAGFIKRLTTNSFSNSRIGANTLGTISLGAIQSENADRQLGTAADRVTQVTGSTNRGLINIGRTDGPLNTAEDDLLIRVY